MQQDPRLEEWRAKFKDIIMAYARNRAPDPFMTWFRQKNSEGFFANDFERVLVVLIDSRFNQNTTAETALQNTIAVVEQGSLKRLINREELPLLNTTQYKTAEKWTDLFFRSLPRLHELARRIVAQREWDAAELFRLMLRDIRVPFLWVKTSRLAVRWLHELIPSLSIDMTSYKIPIDRHTYRVATRLGIIDPNLDKYLGDDSSADLRIQSFVRQISPDKPWLLDEPLWATGRKAANGGHCFPQGPNCKGCIFESICPRKFLDIIPEKVGMETGYAGVRSRCIARPKDTPIPRRVAEFAKFVDELKRKGVSGEEYRAKVAQWRREHED